MIRRPKSMRRWSLIIDGLLLGLILSIGIWSWPREEGPISGYPELDPMVGDLGGYPAHGPRRRLVGPQHSGPG